MSFVVNIKYLAHWFSEINSKGKEHNIERTRITTLEPDELKATINKKMQLHVIHFYLLSKGGKRSVFK